VAWLWGGLMSPLSTTAHYFEFTGYAHAAGCAAGPGWEVAQHVERGSKGEPGEVTLRLVCRSCGVVYLQTFASEPVTWWCTTVRHIGYGSPPVLVAGLWLHPGRQFSDDGGPETYLVTTGRATPSEKTELVGAVAWRQGPRGSRIWTAAFGFEPAIAHADGFRSRRAAVWWIADQIAARRSARGDSTDRLGADGVCRAGRPPGTTDRPHGVRRTDAEVDVVSR